MRNPSTCTTLPVRHPALIRPRARATDAAIRPSLQRLLDAITGAPAWVANQRADILATNPLGRALLAPMLDDPANQQNSARFTFFSPASRIFYPDWEHGADSLVASLRKAAGRNPHDKASPISSASSSPAATRSDSAGPPTTSASTGPAPNASIILMSVISSSPTKAWNCPAAPDG